jgi:hypothetical protein
MKAHSAMDALVFLYAVHKHSLIRHISTMLYIIGGASRSGKTLLSKKIYDTKHIPYMPLDVLVGALNHAAPELGIHHNTPFLEKGMKSWKFTQYLIGHLFYMEDQYLVEGDCLLPEHAYQIAEEYNGNVKICFLGCAHVTPEEKLRQIRQYHAGDRDWTNKESDETLMWVIERIIDYSKFLEKECTKYKIRFFDVSHHFKEVHAEAYDWLMSGN